MENSIIFNKILIAVDDSKFSYAAAEYGFKLAKSLGSEVALVHISAYPITTSMTGDPILGDPGIIIPDMMDAQREAAKQLFQKLREELGQNVTVSEFILEGNVKDEVINVAQEFNASLIVMGTHSRKGLDLFLSGSVAESVMRNSNCPVLVIPHKEKE
ncbi:UspA domain-containing protein [Pseudopedobacter saltans DSM 12145]|uniref:Universal stress protein n=1 Tax=Pseudopedobacter saltans (strain ATCC 51119 / DSM 12145 / JCM 21818 / CCUG 39354 / LMG 10337 / NBRC 100064 / NCIMB 13643) TaxID=762903 RepID=F0S7M2_PSESL|nr:universal stress protein [Pseudopedobacter saltans]ADY52282.1 UspA domain-containing protein [Pseudopedobacter saltans DSM 12145]